MKHANGSKFEDAMAWMIGLTELLRREWPMVLGIMSLALGLAGVFSAHRLDQALIGVMVASLGTTLLLMELARATAANLEPFTRATEYALMFLGAGLFWYLVMWQFSHLLTYCIIVILTVASALTAAVSIMIFTEDKLSE